MSLNSLVKLVDNVYGNKDDVISLIKEGDWEKASIFGDHISYNAAINNEDWLWDQINSINEIDLKCWNSCSYGNVAMAVFYGMKFPNRISDIEKLKEIFARDLK